MGLVYAAVVKLFLFHGHSKCEEDEGGGVLVHVEGTFPVSEIAIPKVQEGREEDAPLTV